jgi:hypothetical protein
MRPHVISTHVGANAVPTSERCANEQTPFNFRALQDQLITPVQIAPEISSNSDPAAVFA